MRRTFTTFLACSAALVLGAGQADGQTIGFKAGAAFSNMSGVESDGITGFTGGGHMRFGLGGRLGAQLEVLSVTKGADFIGTGTTQEVRFEYVDIPLLLHLPLTTGIGFAPYLIGGGSVGIEVKCRVNTETAGVETESDCADARNSPDMSLIGGAGLAFAMGPGAVLLEGRYTARMNNIFESDANNARHRTTSIMLGYEVPLTRAW
jgi:hypothetical protein